MIKEILIGPKSDVEVEYVVNFLNFCGYYSSTPISIKKSDISYR